MKVVKVEVKIERVCVEREGLLSKKEKKREVAKRENETRSLPLICYSSEGSHRS